jgi:hypothetical protein
MIEWFNICTHVHFVLPQIIKNFQAYQCFFSISANNNSLVAYRSRSRFQEAKKAGEIGHLL